MRVTSFHLVKKIVSGLNSIEKIGDEAKSLGGKNILIVTDKNIEKLGILDETSRILRNVGFSIDVFDECEPEPRIEIHEKAKEVARYVKPDLIIGLGGGSNMDISKTAAMLVTNEGDATEYVGPPFGLFKKNRLPLILIPTTAGTGSEVTRFSVATVANEKRDMWPDPKLMCDVAIIDPLLTISMPPNITACTAIDALSHAIESLLSREANIMTIPYALEAVKLVSRYVRKAFINGGDVEARYNLSMAATYAGISLCTAGAVLGHAVGYTFAAQHRLPHGMSCGVALPYVMEYNMSIAQERLSDIAKAMEVITDKGTTRDAAIRAIVETKHLIESLEMPTSLKDCNIPRNEIDGMVDRFLSKYKYIYQDTNPAGITREKIINMYEKMWEGKLGSE